MRLGALRVCCVAAAVLTCSERAPAQSPDLEATPPASELSGGAKPEHFLFYSGFDIWRFGRAGFGGFYAAPDGLDNDGFIVRLFASGGRERYDTGAKHFSTDILRGSLLPGWRFNERGFELKGFAGLGLGQRIPTPAPPAAEAPKALIGARVAAETWWEPLSGTMLTSSLSATTNFNGWSARG